MLPGLRVVLERMRMAGLDKWFRLKENGTTAGAEVRGGIVTFLTMSYIIFVQPMILTGTGLSWNTVFVATCVSSAVATVLMAFFANYPIALAPAMGHNVLFLMLCQNHDIHWQTGLGAVFISGLIFILLSFWGIREKLVHAIPDSIKHAIAVGIGLLIAFLGFQWAGLAVDCEPMLVKMGDIRSVPVLLALGGLLFTATLIVLRVRGAILIGILVTAVAGIPLGITPTKDVREKGVLSLPSADPVAKLVILPVHIAAGAETGTPEEDRKQIATALRSAVSEHYAPDKLVPAEQVQAALDAAKPTGFALSPTLRPQEIGDFTRERLGPAVVLFPQVARDQKTGKTELTVVAYNVRPPKVTAEGKREEEKAWRRYKAVPWPEEAAELPGYAKHVMLGLPGHDGLFKLDILGALKLGLLHVIFVFLFLDLFDTIGTLVGVAQQAGFMKDGTLPRARSALLSDACGTVVGAGLGTSTVTSYIESAAGVADGARTGLASLVTALLFIAALFFSPVVQMIGGAYGNLHPAVAPVLIIIGSIMLRNVVHIAWADPTEALPAFLAIMMMPLTFSITEGIAFGFISYSFLKLITRRGREVHWLVYVFSVLFLVRYVYVGT